MKILYVSVDNRCRSILAEAITHHVSEGLVTPCSAGTHPDQSIYPGVYGFLRERNIDTLELRTKSVDEFFSDTAPGIKTAASDIDIVVLLSAEIDESKIAEKFPDSALVCLPLKDLSHSSASDSELHDYFESTVDAIEFRLRKAIVASEAPASGSKSREIVDSQRFIDVYCEIKADDIDDGGVEGDDTSLDSDKAGPSQNTGEKPEEKLAKTPEQDGVEEIKS